MAKGTKFPYSFLYKIINPKRLKTLYLKDDYNMKQKNFAFVSYSVICIVPCIRYPQRDIMKK